MKTKTTTNKQTRCQASQPPAKAANYPTSHHFPKCMASVWTFDSENWKLFKFFFFCVQISLVVLSKSEAHLPRPPSPGFDSSRTASPSALPTAAISGIRECCGLSSVEECVQVQASTIVWSLLSKPHVPFFCSLLGIWLYNQPAQGKRNGTGCQWTSYS